MNFDLKAATFDLQSGVARRALGAGLALGVLADLLLRVGPWGVNATLWAFVLVGAFLWVRAGGAARGSEGPAVPIPRFAAAAALLFALVFAWRAGPPLLAACGLAILVALATTLLSRPSRSGFTAWAIAAFAGGASTAVGPALAAPPALEGAPRAFRPLAVAAMGIALAAPLLLVVSALFASADPLFEHTLHDLVASLDDVIEHGAVIVGAAWLAAGGLVATAAVRVAAGTGIRAPRSAGAVVLVALSLVALLFLAFLAVQARALLGGRELVETTLGLSYAEYARQGFFQLVACAAITLPPLLAADWAIPGDTRARRGFTVLASALILMVAAVLLSAARRLALYVGVYGLTEDRLYGSAFLVWLAVVSIVFALTVLRGARERFALGALAAAGIVVIALAVANPGATIVRVNASHPGPDGFDAAYAASLGADAVPALVDVLPQIEPAARCLVAGSLLARWGAPPREDWRAWSVARWRARREVAGARSALQAMSCAAPLPRQAGASRQA